MPYIWIVVALLVVISHFSSALIIYLIGYRRRQSTGTMLLHTRLQVEYGLSQDRGKRPTMEDAHTVVHSLPISHFEDQEEDGGTTISLFAIMDGHCGNSAACYAAAQLASKVSENWPQCMSTRSIINCLHRAHTLMDAQFLETARTSNILAGCTCLSTVLVTDIDRVRVFTANLGDSRAIVCRHGSFSAMLNYCRENTSEAANAYAQCLSLVSFLPASRLVVPLSIDQKPDISPDRERIEASGGFVHPSLLVYNDKIVMRGPCRIFPGGLAVPRAIGDLPYKDITYLNSLGVSSPLVSSNPVISVYELTDQDEFILQACDGLWDVISSKEAATFVSVMHYIHQLARIPHKAFKKLRRPLKQILYTLGVTSYYSPTSVAVAEALCNHAKSRGSLDNITVSIIFPEFIKSKTSLVELGSESAHNLLSKVRCYNLSRRRQIGNPGNNAQPIMPDQPSPKRSSLRNSVVSDHSTDSCESIISRFEGLKGTLTTMDIDSLVSAAKLIIQIFSNIRTFDALMDAFANIFVDDIIAIESYVTESLSCLHDSANSVSDKGSSITVVRNLEQGLNDPKVNSRSNVLFVDTAKSGEPLLEVQEKTLQLWDDYLQKDTKMNSLRCKTQLTGITESTLDFVEI